MHATLPVHRARLHRTERRKQEQHAHKTSTPYIKHTLSANMYIIGIAGGTGSGKTTVVRKILEALPPGCVSVIPQDSYYNDNTHLSMEDRRKINFDHPDAFDTDLMVQQIAYHLDISSESFLCRFFRRMTGFTPLGYRNKTML